MKFTGELSFGKMPSSLKNNTGKESDYSNKGKFDVVKVKYASSVKNSIHQLRLRNEILIFCNNFPFYIKNAMGTLFSTDVDHFANLIVGKNQWDVSWFVYQDVNAQEV